MWLAWVGEILIVPVVAATSIPAVAPAPAPASAPPPLSASPMSDDVFLANTPCRLVESSGFVGEKIGVIVGFTAVLTTRGVLVRVVVVVGVGVGMVVLFMEVIVAVVVADVIVAAEGAAVSRGKVTLVVKYLFVASV
jgi:hypothetical protein